MSLDLILGLLALFFTAAIGVPVAFAIIIGVITYLSFAGQDIAIAGETIVQRLYDGFFLLNPKPVERREFLPPSIGYHH